MIFQVLFLVSTISFLLLALYVVRLRKEILHFKDYAHHDPLTRVGNRRMSAHVFADLVSMFKNHGRAFSIAMIDIDNLKLINDSSGHGAGDLIIKDFARALTDSLRRADTVIRFGGDEFLVFLPDTNLECAEQLMMKFCGDMLPRMISDKLVTASVGVGEFTEKDLAIRNPSRWFADRVDKALYEAKRAGKNCVRVSRI
jgi:diguanylate cyclase